MNHPTISRSRTWPQPYNFGESPGGRGRAVGGHRVGVAFPEGLELLPFYENLAEGQLLPFYAHFLSVTFTVLPQTMPQTQTFFIGVLRVPPPPATPV